MTAEEMIKVWAIQKGFAPANATIVRLLTQGEDRSYSEYTQEYAAVTSVLWWDESRNPHIHGYHDLPDNIQFLTILQELLEMSENA